LVHIIY